MVVDQEVSSGGEGGGPERHGPQSQPIMDTITRSQYHALQLANWMKYKKDGSKRPDHSRLSTTSQ